MTTSGTTTLGYTVNEIFTEALDDLGIIGDGESLSGNHFARCKRAANLMLQQWKAQGNHLWTKTEGYLFSTKGTASYNLSSARAVNNYTKTTTSAAAVLGASTITVTSATGIATTDVIGILLSDNTMQWTTVNGAPSGTTVTLTDTLTGAVNSGATVFHYGATETLSAVERIRQVRRIDTSDYEIPLNLFAREQYFGLPDKASQATPSVAYADRQRDAVTLYFWATPDRSDYVFPFSYERKIEVITNAAETWDIPEYWFNALVLNLAVRVAPRFGVSPLRIQMLEAQAMDAMDIALSFDTEITDLRFTL